MIKLFDYVFYRIHNFSLRQKDTIPIANGVLILSLLQFLTILDVHVFLHLFYPLQYPIKLLGVVVLAVIAFSNYRRYNNPELLEELQSEFGNEPQGKRKRNEIIIAICLICSFLVPMIYGILMHNLKLIS